MGSSTCRRRNHSNHRSLAALSLIAAVAALCWMSTCTGNPMNFYNPSFQPFPTNRNLKNLPCVVLRTGAEGVCMFAIHCLKANGTHLGTCRDGYYFKSCCHINEEPAALEHEISDNSIDQNTISHFQHHSTADVTYSTTHPVVQSNSVKPLTSADTPSESTSFLSSIEYETSTLSSSIATSLPTSQISSPTTYTGTSILNSTKQQSTLVSGSTVTQQLSNNATSTSSALLELLTSLANTPSISNIVGSSTPSLTTADKNFYITKSPSNVALVTTTESIKLQTFQSVQDDEITTLETPSSSSSITATTAATVVSTNSTLKPTTHRRPATTQSLPKLTTKRPRPAVTNTTKVTLSPTSATSVTSVLLSTVTTQSTPTQAQPISAPTKQPQRIPVSNSRPATKKPLADTSTTTRRTVSTVRTRPPTRRTTPKPSSPTKNATLSTSQSVSSVTRRPTTQTLSHSNVSKPSTLNITTFTTPHQRPSTNGTTRHPLVPTKSPTASPNPHRNTTSSSSKPIVIQNTQQHKPTTAARPKPSPTEQIVTVPPTSLDHLIGSEESTKPTPSTKYPVTAKPSVSVSTTQKLTNTTVAPTTLPPATSSTTTETPTTTSTTTTTTTTTTPITTTSTTTTSPLSATKAPEVTVGTSVSVGATAPATPVTLDDSDEATSKPQELVTWSNFVDTKDPGSVESDSGTGHTEWVLVPTVEAVSSPPTQSATDTDSKTESSASAGVSDNEFINTASPKPQPPATKPSKPSAMPIPTTESSALPPKPAITTASVRPSKPTSSSHPAKPHPTPASARPSKPSPTSSTPTMTTSMTSSVSSTQGRPVAKPASPITGTSTATTLSTSSVSPSSIGTSSTTSTSSSSSTSTTTLSETSTTATSGSTPSTSGATSAPSAPSPANTNRPPIVFPEQITETTTNASSVSDTIVTSNGTSIAPDEFTEITTMMSLIATTPSLADLNYTQVCGKRMYPEPRIVGGSKASFGRWPWQISLRQWRTSTYLHKCGAALLNENWAITAAHCVENVPPSDLLLRLGEYDLAEEEEPYGYQERRVYIVVSHPQFDARTFEYDLALLRFFEPVEFQPNIIPVCVPDSDETFIGRTAFVTGWGRLYEDGPLPSVLQEVTVPVINNTICESMYRSAGYIEHIPNIFICAGWKKGGYDSCEGDSGGPMVIQRDDKRFQLAGVISWGIGCAEVNQPGVYTRISEFRDWINQILKY